MNNSANSEYSKGFDCINQAADYFKSQLQQSPTAKAYLMSRGISGQTAGLFGLGYAPMKNQALKDVFGKDYFAPILRVCGLLGMTNNQITYDKFKNRLMFPIENYEGRLVGFGGRVLSDRDTPKYLNSPASRWFSKGSVLFGYRQAMRRVQLSNTVLVVEGYLDVLSLVEKGVHNVVAPLGTAINVSQITQLLSVADKVVFCYDGDDAGRAASVAAMKLALPVLSEGKGVEFVLMPVGEDPDSYIRRFGREAFNNLVGRALSLTDMITQHLVSSVQLSVIEDVAKMLGEAKTLVGELHNMPLIQWEVASKICGLAEMPLDVLLDGDQN